MKNFITDKKERVRFVKFLGVGLSGAVIDFGTLNLLTYFAGMELVYAQAISFVLAVTNNFIWNRVWTYPDSRSKPLANQLGQFFLINGIGILVRTPIILLSEKVLFGILNGLFSDVVFPFTKFLTIERIAENLAVVVAIFIVLLWNFFANRLWTYNDVE